MIDYQELLVKLIREVKRFLNRFLKAFNDGVVERLRVESTTFLFSYRKRFLFSEYYCKNKILIRDYRRCNTVCIKFKKSNL